MPVVTLFFYAAVFILLFAICLILESTVQLLQQIVEELRKNNL